MERKGEAERGGRDRGKERKGERQRGEKGKEAEGGMKGKRQREGGRERGRGGEKDGMRGYLKISLMVTRLQNSPLRHDCVSNYFYIYIFLLQ